MSTNSTSQSKQGKIWIILAIIAIICAIICIQTGFNKLFVYKNTDYSSVNSYVGGDAYNYIINANYATAYFVLAGINILSAFGCGIMWNLKQLRTRRKPIRKAQIEDIEENLPQL